MPVFLIANAVLALTLDALWFHKSVFAVALENLYPEMMTVPLMQVGKPMLFFTNARSYVNWWRKLEMWLLW
jgi:hypothetical protein